MNGARNAWWVSGLSFSPLAPSCMNTLSNSPRGSSGFSLFHGLVYFVRFDKAFHVSPFMSMKHTYDWKFTPPKMGSGSGLTAQTTLLEAENGKISFDAKVILKR